MKQHSIVWDEELYSYKRETREEVLSFVREKAPSD
jgi:hypothetical protein